jgi:hypothetical protein
VPPADDGSPPIVYRIESQAESFQRNAKRIGNHCGWVVFWSFDRRRPTNRRGRREPKRPWEPLGASRRVSVCRRASPVRLRRRISALVMRFANPLELVHPNIEPRSVLSPAGRLSSCAGSIDQSPAEPKRARLALRDETRQPRRGRLRTRDSPHLIAAPAALNCDSEAKIWLPVGQLAATRYQGRNSEKGRRYGTAANVTNGRIPSGSRPCDS